MKCLLALLIWCRVGWALGNHMEVDSHGKLLQVRDPTHLIQENVRPIDKDYTHSPRMFLSRRGTSGPGEGRPDWRVQTTGDGTSPHSQGRRSGSPHNRNGEASPRSKSSIKSHGPAKIWASNSVYPGDHRNVQRKHVRQGERGSLHTGYHAGTIAGGEAIGSPSPDGSQYATESYPLKAKAKGRTAIGRVVAPVGGQGHIRIEDTTGVSTLNVPGGSTLVNNAYTPGRYDAKVEASVTRGGEAQAGAQPYDRIPLDNPANN